MVGAFDRGTLRSANIEEGVTRFYWTGREWQLATARFWEAVTANTPAPTTHRLGRTLREEVGVCILGGYGATWDVIEPYLRRVQASGLLAAGARISELELVAMLRQPVRAEGRSVRYRFPVQRAARLSAALQALDESWSSLEYLDDRGLRDELAKAPGIGLKTASWIVRNHRRSPHVAVVDVHLVRAGVAAGVFSPRWRVAREYRRFEAAFLEWCRAAALSPLELDAAIWSALSGRGSWAQQILGPAAYGADPRAIWPVAGQDERVPA